MNVARLHALTMQSKSYAAFLTDIRNLISDIQISDSKLDPRYVGEVMFENKKYNLPQNFVAYWCRLDEENHHYQHSIDELEICVERSMSMRY